MVIANHYKKTGGIKMKNLIKLVTQEHEQNLKGNLEQIKSEKGLNDLMSCYGKKYKKNAAEHFIKFLAARNLKSLNENLALIESVKTAPDFGGEFVITIEWTDSRMWRSNPRAYTNYGFKGDSIGGCGYDKKSTASAQALNSHLPILKLLFEKKNKEIMSFKAKDSEGNKLDWKNGYNRLVLGYGLGYGLLPHFEGGVGVECHITILTRLGLDMQQITNTKNTDVFLIKKA